MAGHWWRAYDEALDDPKIQRLSPPLFKAWFNLCCLTSANGGVLPPISDIAFRLRISEQKAEEIIAELTKAELIDTDETGTRPHNWDGRQFQSDVSTDRVKRHRQKKRNVSGNVSPAVTRNVSETASETPPDTDTDSDTESETDSDAKQTAGALRQDLVKAFEAAGNPNPIDTSRAEVWLAQGYDPKIIIAVAREVVAKKPNLRSLSYLDQPIREAHEKRKPPDTADAKSRHGPGTITDRKHAKLLVDQWKREAWQPTWGPKPDEPDCYIAPSVLKELGVTPAAEKTA